MAMLLGCSKAFDVVHLHVHPLSSLVRRRRKGQTIVSAISATKISNAKKPRTIELTGTF